MKKSKVAQNQGLWKMEYFLFAEFFIDALGHLHIGSCSDVIVSHASKIILPWSKTDVQKAYEKFRYSSSATNAKTHNEIFYFKNRFKCMTSQWSVRNSFDKLFILVFTDKRTGWITQLWSLVSKVDVCFLFLFFMFVACSVSSNSLETCKLPFDCFQSVSNWFAKCWHWKGKSSVT